MIGTRKIEEHARHTCDMFGCGVKVFVTRNPERKVGTLRESLGPDRNDKSMFLGAQAQAPRLL